MSITFWKYSLLFLCQVGFVLSIYAYSVKMSKQKDENFKAMCDISEHMSCSKVFMSEYGVGFGLAKNVFGEHSIFNLPNSLIGVVFYQAIAIFTILNVKKYLKIIFALNVLSIFSTIYLAYILYVLQDVCVVCISTYAVNLLNLYVTLKLKDAYRTIELKKKYK